MMEGPPGSALTPCRWLQLHPTGRDGASVVPSRQAGQPCHQPRGTGARAGKNGQNQPGPRNSLSKLTPRDGEKLLGTSSELQPSLWAAEWGSRTPCSGLGWLGVGVWGSRASTFSRVSGLAPAHRQALRYVLVIRLQVQLPLHLQGMGLIRRMATATAPHSAHDKSAAVIDAQGIPPQPGA